jgi:hypothetical protein
MNDPNDPPARAAAPTTTSPAESSRMSGFAWPTGTSLLVAPIVLAGWLYVQRLVTRTNHVPGALAAWWAIGEVTLVGVLALIASRLPRFRQGITLALAFSVFAMPWVQLEMLDALMLIRVGGYGDFGWILTPPDLYPATRWMHGQARLGIPLVLAVMPAVLLVAARRPRVRQLAMGIAIALVVVLSARGIVHTATRPPLARWPTAFPLVARVPLASVAAGDAFESQTVLPGGVRLRRHASDEAGRVQFVAETLEPGNALFYRRSLPLECRGDVTLALRRLPSNNLVLSCGDAPEDFWSHGHNATAIDVHGWHWKLLTGQLLTRVAPPPGWLGSSLLGLTVALCTIFATRSRRAANPAHEHPYRERPGEAPLDSPNAALWSVSAMAIAIHGASPLVLAAWWQVISGPGL